jgi:hypothetical protein
MDKKFIIVIVEREEMGVCDEGDYLCGKKS